MTASSDAPASPFATRSWPTEIRYKNEKRALEIDFDDGLSFAYPAELLRVESPSAEVQGHGGGKTIVAGRRNVGITSIDTVGNYAIRLNFDDGHDTGIYSWSYLREIGEHRDTIWQTYLSALEAQALSRDS